jgi:hypothetical protein
MLDDAICKVNCELSQLEAKLQLAVLEVISLHRFLYHLLMYIPRLVIEVVMFFSLWFFFDGMPIRH